MSKIRKQAGFTILELMIATMVFSLILLLTTYGIIRIGNRYYKSTLQTQSQAAARNAIDEVSRNIQFSAGGQVLNPASAAGNTGAYCSNGIQYAYVLGRMQDSSGANGAPRHILVARPDPGGCTPPAYSYFQGNLADSGRDMLGNRMRIASFNVAQIGPNPNVYTITLRITTGEDDLLCSPGANDCNSTTVSTNLGNGDLQCKAQAGSTYCAASALSTIVTRRLTQ